jgi:hypothetical protein
MQQVLKVVVFFAVGKCGNPMSQKRHNIFPTTVRY